MDSAPIAHDKPVGNKSQAAEEEKRRQILRDDGTNRQGNINPAVSAGEVMNHARQEHI